MSLEHLAHRERISSLCQRLRESIQQLHLALQDTLNADQYALQGATQSWQERHTTRLLKAQRCASLPWRYRQILIVYEQDHQCFVRVRCPNSGPAPAGEQNR